MKDGMKNDGKTKKIVQTAVLAAIIYIFTAYLHIPHWTGYVHVGDAFIYLAASILPPWYAAAAGALGAGMADLLSGYALWAPGTVIIKILTAFCFTSRQKNILCRRNCIAILPALVLCTGGYYLYECIITGNMTAPLAGIPGYLIQTALSAAIYILMGKGLDRLNFKNRL